MLIIATGWVCSLLYAFVHVSYFLNNLSALFNFSRIIESCVDPCFKN